jgi:hypothetical protein
MRSVATVVGLGLAFLVSGDPGRAGEGDRPAEDWLARVLAVWTEKDATAAFEALEAGQTPLAATERYMALAQHVFAKRRDVAGTILASRAGIQFALDHARGLPPEDGAGIQLRGHAKTIAYDLGANLWPGWMEEGVTLGPVERAIGLDAARLNLRLGTELRRPDVPMGNAHWLLGAQLLASGDFAGARQELDAAAARFRTAAKPAEVLMAEAYAALADRLRLPSDGAAREALGVRLAVLLTLPDENAKFYAEQVRTAERAFAK